MFFYTIVIILITHPLIQAQGNSGNSGNPGNSGNSGNPGNEPFCSPPNVPLNNATAAFEYINLLEKCSYQWWKAGSAYHGMRGYKQVYGDIGYMFNRSTIWEHDGKPTRGYMNARARVVVAQNFISQTKAAYDIQLLGWSNYTVFYRYTGCAVKQVGKYQVGANKTITSFVRKIWFNDGIVKYSWTNSTNSTFKKVFTDVILTTTETISARLGYLNDDEDDINNYIQNPIQFIFIFVLCALTAIIASCVYLLLKCTLHRSKTRSNVVNIHSIATHSNDESQELHQLKS
eukprot:270755_1